MRHGLGLHKLTGNRKGQWAMTVNGPWCICFRFKAGDAYDVAIVDYHQGRRQVVPVHPGRIMKLCRAQVSAIFWIRQIAMEDELEIVSSKAARDHVHVFLSYRPTQRVSQIVQWLKGISSRILLQEFPRLRKRFWGRHFWARGYFAVSSGTITDEMIQEYINEQEGEEIVYDSRFPIDSP